MTHVIFLLDYRGYHRRDGELADAKEALGCR